MGKVGITQHAADALGDIVFVELPDVDSEMDAGETFGSVESVKAASDVYLPAGGEVVETNEVRPSRALTKSLFQFASEHCVTCAPYTPSPLSLPTPVNPANLHLLQELESNPSLVNESPEGDGWFVKIKVADEGEFSSLMDEAAYKAYLETLE